MKYQLRGLDIRKTKDRGGGAVCVCVGGERYCGWHPCLSGLLSLNISYMEILFQIERSETGALNTKTI